MPSFVATVLARLDPGLTARIVARRPLLYVGGADRDADRPAHVRAASGLAWLGDRLVVVQDDAQFLGVVDIPTGMVTPIDLPAGPGGRRTFDARRGNKADKHDLEAIVAAERDGSPLVIALGSGGDRGPRRVAITLDLNGAVAVHDVAALMARIAAVAVPGGGSLNLEGAAIWGDRLVVANRGNETAADGSLVTCTLVSIELSALWAALRGEALTGAIDAVGYQLGELGGGRLTFTELATLDGRLGYLAAAEDTRSYFDDGAVAGSVLGVLDGGPGSPARHAAITDEQGALAAIKLEGLARWRPGRLLAAADPDDPDRPGELVELALDGPW